jgi:hypothetical protein
MRSDGRLPTHQSGIRRRYLDRPIGMSRVNHVNPHHRQTINRKGANRIIRIVILISVGRQAGYGNVGALPSMPRAMRRNHVGSQLQSTQLNSANLLDGRHRLGAAAHRAGRCVQRGRVRRGSQF